MSNKNESAGTRIAAGMGGIRGVWLDEAEEAYEAGAAAKAESPFSRFLHSGWAVAAACAVTALGVFAAILAMGHAGGGWGRTPVTPGGNPAGSASVHEYVLSDGTVIPDSRPDMTVSAGNNTLSVRARCYRWTSTVGQYEMIEESDRLSPWENSHLMDRLPLPVPERTSGSEFPGLVDGTVTQITLSWDTPPARVTVGLYTTDGGYVDMLDEREPTIVPESGLTLTSAIMPTLRPLVLHVAAEWGKNYKTEYSVLLTDPKKEGVSILPDGGNGLSLAWKDCARENIRSDAIVSGSGYMAYMAPPLSRVPVVPTSMDPKDWEPDTSLPEAESQLTEPILRFPMPAEGDDISFFWESVPTFVSVGLNRIDRKNNVLIPLACPFTAEQGAEFVTLKRGGTFPSYTELLLVVSAVWADSETATYRILLEAWSDDPTKLPADDGLTVYISAFAAESYHCVLVPGIDPACTPIPMDVGYRTPEQMRDILAAYGLPADRIRVELYQNWLSSYIWPYMMGTDESGRVLTDGDKLGMKMEIEDTLRDRLGIPLTAEQREERVKQYFPLE